MTTTTYEFENVENRKQKSQKKKENSRAPPRESRDARADARRARGVNKQSIQTIFSPARVKPNGANYIFHEILKFQSDQKS